LELCIALTHTYQFTVPASAIDGNGHVNNIEYVRWMQDAAIAHSDAVGCTAATAAHRALWVVRRHNIEYRRPAFVGDVIDIRTWIADCRMVSSRRKYEFVRPADNTLLARGETDWVLLDAATFKPLAIPQDIQDLYNPPGAAGETPPTARGGD
jgi:acyl-CoA thioester hydrolase